MMLAIGKRVAWTLRDVVVDDKGCYIIVRGWLNQLSITLVGVYDPNAQQTLFWEKIIPLNKNRYAIY